MAKFKLKFEGFFELESQEQVLLKPGEKYKIKAVLEGENEQISNLQVEEVEVVPNEKQVTPIDVVQVIPALAVTEDTPVRPQEEVSQANWISNFVTLEQFGGQGYYKLIKKGLSYKGSLIQATDPIFSAEDVGKTFCGLFAHRNPLEPKNDEYYPGIVGSRYALITEVLDSRQIRVNFEFNGQSDMGYVFFDNSLAYQAAMNAAKKAPHHTLELQDGKTYVIPEFTRTDLSSDLFVFARNRASLKIGYEDYFSWADVLTKKQDGFLFDFGGQSVNIGFYNVNFLPPHRRVKSAQLFFSSLFKSVPNKDQRAKIAIVNMDTTLEVDPSDPRQNQIGFGYGFMYSSEKGNYVIGKNIKHRGPGFMDFKASFGGGLYGVFENVVTDFKDESLFSSSDLKVKGVLKDNVFTITSGHTIFQIYTYNFGEGNVAHILHIQGYTFVIDGKPAVINATQFKVRPFAKGTQRLLVRNETSVYCKTIEMHAGDQLTLNGAVFTVVEKTRTYVTEWSEGGPDIKYAMCLKLDKSLPVSTGFHDFQVKSVGETLNSGNEVEAYLIYKANYEFRTFADTKFGNSEVLSSTPVGHLSYNHKEISLWAKNFKHNGFYRQSLSGIGASNGYTLIDCEGFADQFAPDVEVKTTGEMPKEAEIFLGLLDQKFKKVSS